MSLRPDDIAHIHRAAKSLATHAAYLESACADVGVTMPAEVRQALGIVRDWTRSLGVRDAKPSRVQELLSEGARPRQRGQWRRTSR